MDLLRKSINLWLLAVAADGAARLLAGLVEAITGSRAAMMLIFPFELVAVLGMIPLWFAVALVPRIPVRVVLPPMVAVCWMLLGALPFSVLFYNEAGFQLSIGLVLMASVALSEALARTASTNGRWLLTEPLGDELGFTARHLLAWLAGWWLLAPAVAAVYAVGGFAWTLWWGTSGFLVATPTGLAVAHKAYTHGDDTVDLVAMIHLGEEEAYDQLFTHIPAEGTLVLAEGITDRENKLSAPRNAYGRAASAIGLTVQKPAEELFRDMEVENADVDVSTFTDTSIELLNVALGMYAVSDNPEGAIADYLAFWTRHRSDTRQVTDQLFADILYARNDHLVERLDARLPERDRIVLPWGALHMVGLEETLEGRGWTHTETHRVVLIRWSTLLGR